MTRKKNTISFSISRGIMVFLIPINLLLLLYSVLSWSFLRQQTIENYADTLDTKTQQVENALESLENWVQSIFFSAEKFPLLIFSQDDTTRYLTAQEINQQARIYLELYPYETTFFIRCGDEMRIPAVSTFSNTANNSEVTRYIRGIGAVAEQQKMGEYFLQKLGDRWYLAICLKQRDVYAGVLVDTADLLDSLDLSGSILTSYHLEDRDGAILAVSGSAAKNDTLLRSELFCAPVAFGAAISGNLLLGRFRFLTNLSFILLFLAIVSLVIYIVYTKHQVGGPLKKLQDTIKKIEAGDLEQKIDVTGEKDEISQVYQTFNSFIDDIVHLKLVTYEEKLAHQQTELQYLRLQLRPHFFLNSMKRLYALAQQGQIDDVQEYILCLSTHYRFLIYDTTNTITLQEEMRHVQNYIQLQRIGYHLTIDCQVTMDVNPTLIQVPPLVVQSFIENSIKHAVRPGQPLLLTVQATLLTDEEMGTALNIVCTDNGPGFPREVIEAIGGSNEEFAQKHVGFNNLRHRLALIYEKESFLYVYNQPDGGAVVDILIPVEAEETENPPQGKGQL